jgi:asparagine synthase (glutamine-hydrolysing)
LPYAESCRASYPWAQVHQLNGILILHSEASKHGCDAQLLANTSGAILGRITREHACVHAWAADHSSILHNLSGGLDSSIVLSCLKSAPSRPRVECLNYFNKGRGEDERVYARMMARSAQVEFMERPVDPAEVRLERALEVRPSARPWMYLYELQHEQIESSLAARQDATALFSGGGRDAVFI